MDILSMLQGKSGGGDLLSQIASQLGLEQREVEETTKESLPVILEGLRRNASSTEGAASLSKALADHAKANVRDVQDVDAEDGRKILGHIFGGENEQLAQQAGIFDSKKGGILAMLAPILMNMFGQQKEQSGIDISDLGAIFGGGSGGGLLDSLTGMLGGGDQKKKEGGGLLDSLGDLFKR